MDRPRKDKPKKRGPLYIALGIVAAVAITVGLARLEPAPPGLEAGTILIDTVRRGPLVKAVRGNGTLVPEEIQIIPAITAGRVEQILVRPGTPVTSRTVILRLSNPDVQLQLLEARRQLSQARSELVNLESTLRSQQLNQEAVVAGARTQFNEAERQHRLYQELIARNLATQNEADAAKDRYEEMTKRLEVEKERLDVMKNQAVVQVESQQRQVESLDSIVAYREQDLASLEVRALTEGVLQVLGNGVLEVGQWVSSGTELARVVKPERLKAVLRIPEAQAADVAIGQLANVDTRNGIVQGQVVRIDPASQSGTVGVDIGLPAELPSGTRPDQSVDGNIEITRLEDVLYVTRPTFGAPNTTIGLFRLVPGSRDATRVTVQLGVSSVNHVEVRSGLMEGDAVIVSDMSAWDAWDRIRLK